MAYIRQFLRPSYHWRRICEDVRSARLALANMNLDRMRDEPEKLANAFRGRLFATFILSGVFGIFGPVLGTVFQYSSGNPTEGFLIGLLFANIFGTIGFQVIWYAAHRRMYLVRSPSPFGRFLALERDLLPLQLEGFKWTLLFLLITVPIMLLLIHLIKLVSEHVARVIPFALVAPIVEMLVVHSSLIRVMGDLFEKHSVQMTARYLVAESEGSFPKG
ncbi:MAG: hypothetical protein MH204_07520 [Fimbriimonadaceae bacterium]|nr:hypothetical protein [Fimbriimonadaceae bacterium]